MFRPLKDTVDSVLSWLAASSISEERITHFENKGWLAFNATAKEAEELFLAEFHEYEHSTTGNMAAACDKQVALAPP